MPESTLEEVDYYPPDWVERVQDDTLIEWIYDPDPAIQVRVDGGEDAYRVDPITGVNDQLEEVVTRPVTDLERESALDIGITLVYAINGTIGRLEGWSEFTGDQD